MRADLKRTIQFRPAFNRRHPDPAKDYGIGAVLMVFILHGPDGAAQYIVNTGWYLPGLGADAKGEGFSINYHAKQPNYEGQPASDEACPWTGGPCYCDGSALAGEKLFHEFVRRGEEVVWAELEEWYADRVEVRG